jgi:hypothetical protein
MWIPHRVFFATVAIVIGVALGVLLLAWRTSERRHWVEAIGAPALAVGAFLGLTATRGMPLLWWERLRIMLWVALLVAAWLAGAAVAVGVVRRHGGSRVAQMVVGGVAALVAFIIIRAMLLR